MVGKVLINFVILAMPIHLLSHCVEPNLVTDEVENVCRVFLWGEKAGSRKVHCLSWDKCCTSTRAGVLGFMKIRSWHQALSLLSS